MSLFSLIAQAESSDIFGTVEKPLGVERFDQVAGGGENIGLLSFVSSFIQVMTVVAGIWVLFQFILAGFDYITANGNTQANTKVKDRLTMSIIGLVIIVSVYAISGVLGLAFFGDASYILNPKIDRPQDVQNRDTQQAPNAPGF